MNELSSRLRPLQEEYARRLPEKIEQLEELWNKLLYVDWRVDLFALLQRMVHNLAGSGGSFGFPELSEQAAQLDAFLRACLNDGKPLSPSAREHITSALGSLRGLLGGELEGVGGSVPADLTGIDRALIFVVDDDAEFSALLELQLSLLGYRLRCFDDIDGAIAAAAAQQPAAVLMDIMFPRSSRAGIDAVAELRVRTGARVPVVFMSARTDMTARLEALRAGGDAYFTKPLDFDALGQKLSELVAPNEHGTHRVLVLEHDSDRADAHCEALESVGMVCRRLRNGLQLIEEIVQFRPDLILMERKGGTLDGVELAAAVRQDPQFAFTPIVFTVEHDDPELRNQALLHGVDDVIANDTPVAELAACVHERIHSAVRISRRARMLSVRDPLTGTLNRGCFLERVDAAVASEAHSPARPAMLYAAVDQVELLRRDLGVPCFRAVISQLASRALAAIAAGDALSYFGNGIFTVLTRSGDSASLRASAKQLLEAISGTPVEACGQTVRVTCSIGVTVLQTDDTNGSALLVQAERAAAQARESGGARVFEYRFEGDSGKALDADFATSLDQALEAKSFRLAFQPILRLDGEHEEMYEALLRLVDERGRCILPGAFMERLRATTHLPDVDRWVIEHAIETLAEDRRTRGSTRFFIKLSDLALSNRMLPVWVSNCLRDSRLIGQDRVVFEAAEADVAAHLEQTVSLASGLRQLHCAFALEHFGASADTDVILERIRPDYVKIQGAAVRGAAADSVTAARIRSLIERAAAAGATVIVGEVEDAHTLALLWDMGLRYFQGYAIRAPDNSLDFDFQKALKLTPEQK